jgi:hypothetical protein
LAGFSDAEGEREKKRFLTRDEEASTALSASSEKSQEKVREGERK